MSRKRIKRRVASAPGWLKSLPVEPGRLTLEELRHLKDADDYLSEKIEGPECWQYFHRCFTFLFAFSVGLYAEKRFSALNRCWDDFRDSFLKDPDLNDGVFTESWMFCDFPIGSEGQTCLDYFGEYLNEHLPDHDFRHFLDEMAQSRLGLYQEIMSTRKITRFRELFTGEVVSTQRTVEGYQKGEIFLTRLVNYKGEVYQFCNPKCWPGPFRENLEDNVLSKLFYFEGETFQERYRRYMKLAGPYWFSCVTRLDDFPILPPDHYLTYLRD